MCHKRSTRRVTAGRGCWGGASFGHSGGHGWLRDGGSSYASRSKRDEKGTRPRIRVSKVMAVGATFRFVHIVCMSCNATPIRGGTSSLVWRHALIIEVKVTELGWTSIDCISCMTCCTACCAMAGFVDVRRRASSTVVKVTTSGCRPNGAIHRSVSAMACSCFWRAWARRSTLMVVMEGDGTPFWPILRRSAYALSRWWVRHRPCRTALYVSTGTCSSWRACFARKAWNKFMPSSALRSLKVAAIMVV